MSKVLKTIGRVLASGIAKAIPAVAVALKEVLKYLNRKADKAEQKEKHKAVDDANKKIEDACEKGTIDDLLDATSELGKVVAK